MHFHTYRVLDRQTELDTQSETEGDTKTDMVRGRRGAHLLSATGSNNWHTTEANA